MANKHMKTCVITLNQRDADLHYCKKPLHVHLGGYKNKDNQHTMLERRQGGWDL